MSTRYLAPVDSIYVSFCNWEVHMCDRELPLYLFALLLFDPSAVLELIYQA